MKEKLLEQKYDDLAKRGKLDKFMKEKKRARNFKAVKRMNYIR